jgi:ATP/maltotriose-dependent transcriptional regulator MalT
MDQYWLGDASEQTSGRRPGRAARPAPPVFTDADFTRIGDEAGSRPSLMQHLTEREQEVLRYVPSMLSAAEIGGELYVSVNTIKAHLRSIYRKLGVSRRRDAVIQARRHGLL